MVFIIAGALVGIIAVLVIISETENGTTPWRYLSVADKLTIGILLAALFVAWVGAGVAVAYAVGNAVNSGHTVTMIREYKLHSMTDYVYAIYHPDMDEVMVRMETDDGIKYKVLDHVVSVGEKASVAKVRITTSTTPKLLTAWCCVPKTTKTTVAILLPENGGIALSSEYDDD